MIRLANKRIIVIIAGMGALVAILIWVIFFWQMQNIKRLAEDYQKEKLNSLVLREKENKLSQLKRDISNLEDQNKKFQSIFLKKNEALPFLKELEKAAGDASCSVKVNPVDIKKIKFEKSKSVEKTVEEDSSKEDETKNKGQNKEAPKKDELVELKDYPAFTIEAQGSYASVINFLNKAENLPFLVRVLTLDAGLANKKEKTVAGSGALAVGSGAVPASEIQEEKDITLTFVVVVYAQ